MAKSVNNFQTLEDIATLPWLSQVLFLAVEKRFFDILETPKTKYECSIFLKFKEDATNRFLRVLEQIELVSMKNDVVSNTKTAKKYLLTDAPLYQGHSILWRKHLLESWENLDAGLAAGGRTSFPSDSSKAAIKERFLRYSLAMDDIARCKALEIGDIFQDTHIKGDILDLGCGLGAISRYFLEKESTTTAVFSDMEDVLAICKEVISEKIQKRIRFCPMNILKPWTDMKGHKFSLIVMSNILHAFDAADNTALLTKVSEHLTEDGIVLIHDFFDDHCSVKAGIMDINMMINTYNGRVFSYKETKRILSDSRIPYSKFIPLPSDTALVLGAKNNDVLQRIEIKI